MIGLLPIVLVGTLILFLGLRLVLQSSSTQRQEQAVSMEELTKARDALDAVFVESAAIRRIFSSEDMEFIAQSSTHKVQHLFLKERKALAIQWLRKTQKEVAQLMDIHLRLAGYTIEPSPRFELQLTAKYVAFFVASHILLLLLWLRGPFKAKRIVGYTVGVAGYFCTVFSVRLESVSAPARWS
jgi:hypothetical protein